MKVHPRSIALASLKLPLLLLGVLSCTGEVHDSPNADPVPKPPGSVGTGGSGGTSNIPPGGTGGSSGTAGAGGSTPQGGVAAPLPAVWRRLTAVQYRHTVDDLFGTGLTYDKLEGEPSVNGFTTVGGAQVATSRGGVEQFESAAEKIAAQVLADATRKAKVISCTPIPAAFDQACATTSVTKLGRRVFRRPLDQAETDRYVTLWKSLSALSTFTYGAEGVVSAMLQSPKFLYRVEYGQPQAGGVRRFTGYELAGRLSFVLWNTTPDDTLLDAAGRGDLDNDAGITKTAETMLASPKARVGLRDFFAEFLSLDDFGVVDTSSRNVTPALATAMRQQALLDAEDIVFDRNTRFSELLDGTRTHLNGPLAAHYGVPGATSADFVPVTLPAGERVGLLGSGAFLVRQGNGSQTSPVRRGKVILESFLCNPIPPPPDGVVTTLPEFDATTPRTTRQRLEAHRKASQCAACHNQLDPLGLALEKFDSTGKLRTTESGLTIDTSGELEGKPFTGAQQLATILAASPRVAACTVSRLFRYASGVAESPDTADADTVRLAPLQASFTANGGRLRPALLEYLRSSLFTQVSDPL